MKVNTKRNIITVDMNKKEENIFFIHGLQLMIDKNKGKKKFKVVPYDGSIKTKNKINLSDKESEECIKIAILDIIKKYIKNFCKCSKKTNNKCKCAKYECQNQTRKKNEK